MSLIYKKTWLECTKEVRENLWMFQNPGWQAWKSVFKKDFRRTSDFEKPFWRPTSRLVLFDESSTYSH